MTTTGIKTRARAGALAAALAMILATAAQAQDLNFDIPPGDLVAALDAYSKQTGQQLVYLEKNLEGKKSPGAHGAMSPEQALAALLAGTGLKINRDASGAIAIFPAEAVAGGASTQTAGDGQKLEEVIVTATAISQIYTTSRAVTRIDADPMLLPMSVSAVQEGLLQYQQSTSLADALTNVSGVASSSDQAFTSRGFDLNIAQNGVAFGGASNLSTTQLPVVAVERIEVVKGPEQIIQGLTAGIGGTVNLVTKVPTPDDYAFLGGAAGSHGYYRLDADVNGTLVEGKYGSLMGEVIGSTSDDSGGPKGTVGTSTDYVSAALRWTNAEFGSDVSAAYSYSNNRSGEEPVAIGSQHLHYGDKLYVFGDPDSYSDGTTEQLSVLVKQRIVGSWNLDLSYSRQETSSRSLSYSISADDVDPQVIVAYQEKTTNSSGGNSGVGDVYRAAIRGEFNVGPVSNKVLLAYDSQSQDSRYFFSSVGVYKTDLTTGTKVYIPADPPVDYAPYTNGSEQTGVLLIDQVAWGQWHALLGVRWLSATETNNQGYDYSFKNKTSDTLPQLGLVYEWTPQLSLYASRTEGFNANEGFRYEDGRLLPNIAFTQYEGGVKALLMDSKLALTVALYQLKQTDFPQIAGVEFDPFRIWFTTASGLTSNGVEIELAGQPIPGLDIRTTFAYQDSKFDSNDDPPVAGYLPVNFTLWSQYWFSRNSGTGWWVGGGVSAWDAPTRRPGTVTVPGSSLVDLSGGYENEHWRAIAGVKNVGDQKSYYGIGGSVLYGTEYAYAERVPGRQYRFDLSYRF